MKINFDAQGTLTCPAKKTVQDYVKANIQNFKIVVSDTRVSGLYGLYVDEVKNENLFAFITKAGGTDEEGKTVSDEGISERARSIRDAVIEITGATPRTFSCVLQYDEEKSGIVADERKLNSRIEALIEEKILEGIVTKEEMDDRIKVLTENFVDDILIEKIIAGYRKYNKPVHTPSTVYVDPYMKEARERKREGIVAEGLRHAVMRQAAICEGEKSVGKNVFLETIAWLMGMPLYLITFSRQMSPSSIYGEKSTDNSAAKALAEFDSDTLSKADRVNEMLKFSLNLLYKQGIKADEAMDTAMNALSEEDRKTLDDAARFKKLQAQSASVNIIIDASELYDWLKDGGLIVFNEMNMAEANFFASFTNQLLDGTGFLFVPGRGEVPIHKDCVLFGTQNADYEGTAQQNEATMSRFNCLYFKQPESIRGQLVAAVTSQLKKHGVTETLDDKYFMECERFYMQCRKSVEQGIVSSACLNIRGFVRALTAVAESGGYAKLKRWVEICVINTCPTDEREPLYITANSIITL